jgi:iron complex outermembrane recepter protein
MFRPKLLRGLSAGALTLALASAATAQQALPNIDIGASRAHSGQAHSTQRARAATPPTPAAPRESAATTTAAAPGLAPTSYVAPQSSVATKTMTPILRTPANVQVVPQQVLLDQQTTNVAQALQNVSGVTVGGGGAFSNGGPYGVVFLRGFPTSTHFRNGFRIDGFGSTNSLGDTQFANVQSVEVLKGPAAILYGAVEPGGIVNVTTKQPQETAHYSLQQQVGSYAAYRTTASATGPLTQDKSLLYRLDASYENNGSFIDLGFTRNLFFAPVVQWKFDERTKVKLELEYQDSQFNQNYGFTPLYQSRYFVNAPLFNDRSRNYGEHSPFKEQTLFAALSWSHDFDRDWSIRQQIVMNRDKVDAAQIVPFFMVQQFGFALPTPPFPPFSTSFLAPSSTGNFVDRFAEPFKNKSDVYATSVDLTGKFDTGALQHELLVGGDYYRYNFRSGLGLSLNVQTIPIPFVGGFLPNFAGGSLTNMLYPVHPGTPLGPAAPLFGFADQADNIGVYLQDQIKLPYNIEVLGGLRYQYLNQRYQMTDTNCQATTSCTLDNLNHRHGAVDQAVTPRVAVLWRPMDWLSFYGNYTEGFSPNFGKPQQDGNLIPPSKANQWEAGAKAEFFDGRLRATATYYHLVKTNIPIQAVNTTFYHLVGEARSEGPEFDLQGEILPGWQAIVAYANTDVIYSKNNPNFDPAHPTGTRFEGSPRNTVRLFSTYEFQQETLRGLKFGAGYTFHGTQPAWNFSNQYFHTYQLPGYGLVDMMAAYQFSYRDIKVTAQVNVENLLDKSYYTDAEVQHVPTTTIDYQPRIFGSPRAIKGSLKMEF